MSKPHGELLHLVQRRELWGGQAPRRAVTFGTWRRAVGWASPLESCYIWYRKESCGVGKPPGELLHLVQGGELWGGQAPWRAATFGTGRAVRVDFGFPPRGVGCYIWYREGSCAGGHPLRVWIVTFGTSAMGRSWASGHPPGGGVD